MLVRMHLPTGRYPLLGPNLDQVPDQDGGLVLDARRLDFAGPLELAATVALAHAANAKLLSTIFITADNPDVTGYMQRMDVIRRMPADTIIDGRLPTERSGRPRGHAAGGITPGQPDRRRPGNPARPPSDRPLQQCGSRQNLRSCRRADR